jgi:hypothetical protein
VLGWLDECHGICFLTGIYCRGTARALSRAKAVFQDARLFRAAAIKGRFGEAKGNWSHSTFAPRAAEDAAVLSLLRAIK